MLTHLTCLVALLPLLSSVFTGTKCHLLQTRKGVSNGGFLLRPHGQMSHQLGPCVKGAICITERPPLEVSRNIALPTYLASKKVIPLPVSLEAPALPLSDLLGSCYLTFVSSLLSRVFLFKGTSDGRLGFRIRCNRGFS